MIAKELHVLVHVKTFEVAEKVYNDPGTSEVKLTSMFCPRASVYSEWARDLIYSLNIPKDSLVTEFEFFVYGGGEEEKIKTYLHGFGLEPLEIWS